MAKRWRIRRQDVGQTEQLARAADLSPVVAQLLVGRGLFDPQAARHFLDAKMSALRDPELLPGLPEAADRVHAALRAGRRITVYGDYDADGMTSTAILYSCLRLLRANVGYYVPNRLEEGYGLNDEALAMLARHGTSLVISVDCGIASVKEAETARTLGLELIITDHHNFAERLPAAAAVVHPRLPGTSYPFGWLCGAGVAFKLAWALCQRASEAKRVTPALRDFLLQALGLAAIGTVADVVPLIDENRVLVRHGLVSLFERPPLGIRELLRLTKLTEQPRLTSEDIGFTIGPRLNAAGRLGQAQLGVELLTTESQERAQQLAEYLDNLNGNRDSLERSILSAATKQLKERFDPEADPALVLAGAGWHPGVIGIVAGRLAEKYHRPVVMIAIDQVGAKPACGSARTACGVNLHQALNACDELLISHGGHMSAAGLKIEEHRIDAFRAQFCEYVALTVPQEQRVAELRIDAETPLSQLTFATLKAIESLAPFGDSNPRPLLCASGVELVDPPKKMGEGERHLSLRLRQHRTTMRAVAFGQAEWADELSQLSGPLDVAFRPTLNTYRGQASVEMHLVDWRAATRGA